MTTGVAIVIGIAIASLILIALTWRQPKSKWNWDFWWGYVFGSFITYLIFVVK